MKKNHLAMLLGLSLLASSCRDDATPPPADPEPAEQQLPIIPDAPLVPDEEEVRERLIPQLAEFPFAKLAELQVDATPTEQGHVSITARALISIEENLYRREEAPTVFNEERKDINDAANLAMLPNAHYMLQVGAPTEDIREEDRLLRPLPDELQKLADEMKSLAESPVYRLRTPAKTLVEIPVSMRAELQNDQWIFSELRFDTTPLRVMLSLTAESSLPAHIGIAGEGYEAQQRALLRQKIEAFNDAARPYIAAREDEARRQMLEGQTARELALKKAEEEAAHLAACREAWEKTGSALLKEGSVFNGEWKRADAFGRVSLRISRIQAFPESVQFIGTLSDPDLPQAELQITGRCEAPAAPDAPFPCTVHIFNGRYDPDVPTAEVFDAPDGLLRLNLSADGVLSGILTCESWGADSEKAFHVTLNYVVKKPARRSSPAKPAR